MFIKSVLVAVTAAAVGLSIVGCMSADSSDLTTENVGEAAQALTTGVTFDNTTLYLDHKTGLVAAGLNAHYYPGTSIIVFEVPCTATQVGIGATVVYNDTGPQLWTKVTATVGTLPAVISYLPGMTQGTNQSFGQWSNPTGNPLTGAVSDQTIRVDTLLTTYIDSGYTMLSTAPTNRISYYIRRMCTCP